MPTTTNRGYSVPSTGSQSGVWGSDDLNPNFTAIDKNLGGAVSVALSNSNVTLTSNQYVYGTINFSGTLSANVTVTFPSVAGWWTVLNSTTNSNYYIRLSCSSGGAKICPPPGQAIDIGFDGTDAFYRSLPHHIGGYWDYAGNSVPTWVSGCSVPPYLLCDGSSYSTVTYPYLYAILGLTTVVDARGRSRANLNSGTGRISAGVSGIDGDTRFQAGGADGIYLTSDQVPSTSLTLAVSDTGHGHSASTNAKRDAQGLRGQVQSASGQFANDDATVTIGTGYANISASGYVNGGNNFHSNQPPTYIGGITMIRAA
jgi:microcystin-dependent protein